MRTLKCIITKIYLENGRDETVDHSILLSEELDSVQYSINSFGWKIIRVNTLYIDI